MEALLPMPDILELLDLEELRSQVREKYREVAEDPAGDYHFHTGRQHALRLGYPPSPLDRLPDEACEAFAGVANPFYWGGPQPGERVVDLGSGKESMPAWPRCGSGGKAGSSAST
jgi:arsenite methyltransferase